MKKIKTDRWLKEKELVIGKYYYWTSRIESGDGYEYNDRIAYGKPGQFIGFYQNTPVFKEDGQPFRDAVWSCYSNYPRYIFDALECYDMFEFDDD